MATNQLVLSIPDLSEAITPALTIGALATPPAVQGVLATPSVTGAVSTPSVVGSVVSRYFTGTSGVVVEAEVRTVMTSAEIRSE